MFDILVFPIKLIGGILEGVFSFVGNLIGWVFSLAGNLIGFGIKAILIFLAISFIVKLVRNHRSGEENQADEPAASYYDHDALQ